MSCVQSYDAKWYVKEGPQVILEVVVHDWLTADKAPPAAILEACTPGRHLCWTSIVTAPRRQWSPEAKRRERRRRLRVRMEFKYPLLSEQFIAQELTDRASYFELS